VDRDSLGEWALFDSAGNHLLHGDSDLPRDEREANARLIALAPDMASAVKAMVPWLAKMIADGAHRKAVAPGQAERVLARAEELIAQLEGGN
jgi:hypothetical protein